MEEKLCDVHLRGVNERPDTLFIKIDNGPTPCLNSDSGD